MWKGGLGRPSLNGNSAVLLEEGLPSPPLSAGDNQSTADDGAGGWAGLSVCLAWQDSGLQARTTGATSEWARVQSRLRRGGLQGRWGGAWGSGCSGRATANPYSGERGGGGGQSGEMRNDSAAVCEFYPQTPCTSHQVKSLKRVTARSGTDAATVVTKISFPLSLTGRAAAVERPLNNEEQKGKCSESETESAHSQTL